MRNPVMLWQHDPERTIGVWTDARVDGPGVNARVIVRGRLLPPGDELADFAWRRIEAGAVRSLSIGFRADANATERDKAGVLWWGRQDGSGDLEWMETSLVSLPANPAATDVAVLRAARSDNCEDSSLWQGIALYRAEHPRTRGPRSAAECLTLLSRRDIDAATGVAEADTYAEGAPALALFGPEARAYETLVHMAYPQDPERQRQTLDERGAWLQAGACGSFAAWQFGRERERKSTQERLLWAPVIADETDMIPVHHPEVF
jgi:hypothetical protein